MKLIKYLLPLLVAGGLAHSATGAQTIQSVKVVGAVTVSGISICATCITVSTVTLEGEVQKAAKALSTTQHTDSGLVLAASSASATSMELARQAVNASATSAEKIRQATAAGATSAELIRQAVAASATSLEKIRQAQAGTTVLLVSVGAESGTVISVTVANGATLTIAAGAFSYEMRMDAKECATEFAYMSANTMGDAGRQSGYQVDKAGLYQDFLDPLTARTKYFVPSGAYTVRIYVRWSSYK